MKLNQFTTCEHCFRDTMCASAPYKDTEIGEHNRERPMKSFHEEDQAGPSRSSSSEPRGPSIPRFPAALQVGVIRAHEKVGVIIELKL